MAHFYRCFSHQLEKRWAQSQDWGSRAATPAARQALKLQLISPADCLHPYVKKLLVSTEAPSYHAPLHQAARLVCRRRHQRAVRRQRLEWGCGLESQAGRAALPLPAGLLPGVLACRWWLRCLPESMESWVSLRASSAGASSCVRTELAGVESFPECSLSLRAPSALPSVLLLFPAPSTRHYYPILVIFLFAFFVKASRFLLLLFRGGPVAAHRPLPHPNTFLVLPVPSSPL